MKQQPTPSRLLIKHMVCDRCITSVEETLAGLGFEVKVISLGEVMVRPDPDKTRLELISQRLQQKGFELVRGQKDEVVTKIKAEVMAWLKMVETHRVDGPTNDPPLLSEHLGRRLHRTYPTLSRTFSASEGLSIEKYLIRLRIERVKELLTYEEQTLSEIAWRLGYSSVQHLSGQFSSVTGMSVSEFRKGHTSTRKTLDTIR